ncbi:ribose-phosphate pyrophosphokinase [Pelagicoccus albus]|uniref:ribose-phosphate diphosphokinase n=2 Tax=Pelagicoccus albus TaxID=415222 RepID=A0A7X1B723_9BACT|nr:ribose-phosphate pyrophosphokinase [Pelagicoccus albus]
MGQLQDVADQISMKRFANTEFCPRFISDETDFDRIGHKMDGKSIVIVSASSLGMSRQSLAMRTFMIARAAKENGAAEVILVEPDLFYSAQDRGPRPELGDPNSDRDRKDLKKFDGQPFTAKLYAELLKLSGVDAVLTVHNHSKTVRKMFTEVFNGRYHDLIPYEIYVDYFLNSNIVNYGPEGEGLALCAPDKGAREFVKEMFAKLGLPKAKFVLLDKERTGEREVQIKLHAESETTFEDIHGHDIILFDDMVRTGSTVVKSCQFLKQIQPGKTVFAVSHFYASEEGRVKMANTAIDEILTLNTIPTILNRDVQGRLRKKLVVLKIEKWLAINLCRILNLEEPEGEDDSLYQIDMSSKNARWKRKIWLSEQLRTLHKPS